jgi:hypothetical protein
LSLESKFDSDLAELESLTSNVTLLNSTKSVQRGTISSNDVCRSCAEMFDASERVRKSCTNCLADFCQPCLRLVKLDSYNEKQPRLMCYTCIEEVKQKILKWRAVGRGTGRATPPSEPNSANTSPMGSPQVGTGAGRGRPRSGSISASGRGSGFAIVKQ